MAYTPTPMDDQILSLPDLMSECLPAFTADIRTLIGPALAGDLRQVYIIGCGDSHMAAVGCELAFCSLAGVPCRAMAALHFARYTAPFLADPQGTLVIGVSTSGEVARTLEGLRLAHRAGARTVALTANPSSRLALSAHYVLSAKISPSKDPSPAPGVRSYMASLLALDLAAVRIGEASGFLSREAALLARDELRSLSEALAAAAETGFDRTERWVESSMDVGEFVFLGGGPAYGTALYGAAKMFEASGDSADGQDLEEWAHLQYFAREVATPTVIIDCRGRSYGRACEVADAARAIGRRVLGVLPENETHIASRAELVFPLSAAIREAFAPLLYSVPVMCLASERAKVLGETPYRGFAGGRSRSEGGGVSRVQSSALTEEAEG
jgi:glucosamine--fructose-6-phosphate aminotransferase (isomerizing)